MWLCQGWRGCDVAGESVLPQSHHVSLSRSVPFAYAWFGPLGEVPPFGFSEREEPRPFEVRVCHLGSSTAQWRFRAPLAQTHVDT